MGKLLHATDKLHDEARCLLVTRFFGCHQVKRESGASCQHDKAATAPATVSRINAGCRAVSFPIQPCHWESAPGKAQPNCGDESGDRPGFSVAFLGRRIIAHCAGMRGAGRMHRR